MDSRRVLGRNSQ